MWLLMLTLPFYLHKEREICNLKHTIYVRDFLYASDRMLFLHTYTIQADRALFIQWLNANIAAVSSYAIIVGAAAAAAAGA